MKKHMRELTAITHCYLVDYGVISMGEQIVLNPHYRVVINEKEYFHYIVTCKNSLKKYFLKVSKKEDHALHCNDYLQKHCTNIGKNIYPVIITPSFLFDGVYYYVTTFTEGYTLDELHDNLTDSEWLAISNRLRMRLDELSSINASQYSDGNEFTDKDCCSILKGKFIRRFGNVIKLR